MTSADEAPRPLLEEVTEQDASPSVKLIYREIQELSGARMPALIFRRLAVRPDALEWLWRSLQPLLQDGSLQESARLLMSQLEFPQASELIEATVVLREGGHDGLSTVHAILRTYNRVNPINLLIVKIALLLLDGSARPSCHRQTHPLPYQLSPIPEPLPIWAMEPDCRDTVLELAAFVPVSSDGVLVPTMYRHLARWPDIFSLAAEYIKSRLMDGSIQRCAGQLSHEADFVASVLCAGPANQVAPQGDLISFVKNASAPFLTSIPQLSVVGKLLEAKLYQ